MQADFFNTLRGNGTKNLDTMYEKMRGAGLSLEKQTMVEAVIVGTLVGYFNVDEFAKMVDDAIEAAR